MTGIEVVAGLDTGTAKNVPCTGPGAYMMYWGGWEEAESCTST